jgi:hypothetical protein
MVGNERKIKKIARKYIFQNDVEQYFNSYNFTAVLVNKRPQICIYLHIRLGSKWNDYTDYKIITIKGKEKGFLDGVPKLISMFLKSIEIRWIGL